MKDFRKAHSNMIFGQFLPNKLSDERLLHAFEGVRREDFIPEFSRSLSYCDHSIFVGKDREALAPLSLMRLLQKACITKGDHVLDVATGTGYGAVLISHLARSVICLEEDKELYTLLEQNLETAGVHNVTAVQTSFVDGAKKYAPYNVVIVEGRVQNLPVALLDQLKEGGRLLTFEPLSKAQNASHYLSRAVLYRRFQDSFRRLSLFEANAPVLKEFNKTVEFTL